MSSFGDAGTLLCLWPVDQVPARACNCGSGKNGRCSTACRSTATSSGTYPDRCRHQPIHSREDFRALNRLETYHTYDLLDHLTQVSMTRGATTQTRTFNYDATTQRLMSEVHPETGTTTYECNTDGTLKKRTDAAGVIVNYSYDAYKRPTALNGATLTYYMAPGRHRLQPQCLGAGGHGTVYR
jgi:YD repeat-containing protein